MEKTVYGTFKESQLKRIELKSYSTQAVQMFVRFLYGFELEQEDLKNDLELVKDLILMGGVYNINGLQTAASIFLPQYLNTDNMLELMDFVKTQNVLDVFGLCAQYLVKNFDHKKLFTSGLMNQHPELGYYF